MNAVYVRVMVDSTHGVCINFYAIKLFVFSFSLTSLELELNVLDPNESKCSDAQFERPLARACFILG